jgi:rhodanese-related sulfurtransferase
MTTLKPRQISTWTGRIIDVRNPDEFAAERLPKAECVPLGGLAAAVSGWDRKQPLLLMCKSGMRSKQAVQQLESAGFTGISMLEGGIDACKRDGVEVVVDRKRIPLYRQVMIGAGLLLLIGLGLSFVHPAFVLIDWFVAAGLTFAGITGYCPMAKVLEKMPWNAAPCCAGGSCV